MTDEPSLPRVEARALARKRRTKGFERREVILDLLVSGFCRQKIAKALARRIVVGAHVSVQRIEIA